MFDFLLVLLNVHNALIFFEEFCRLKLTCIDLGIFICAQIGARDCYNTRTQNQLI